MKGYSSNVWLPILLASFTLCSCNTPFDSQPPQIEIISPKEGATYHASIPIEIKIADLRTVNRVEVFLDNQLVEIFTREPFVAQLDISKFEQKPMKIRVVAHGRGENTAEAQLSIHHSHGLRIISPNGGESWREASTQTITWEHCGVAAENVSLHYSLNGGSSWTKVTASTPNNGRYLWTVPHISETPNSCQVMVSSIDAIHSDKSDGDFEINRWSPTLVGSCKVSGYPIGVFVSENYAYMTDGYGGLQIVDVSNPARPTRAGTYVTPGDRTWSAFVLGSNAYVADGFLGVHVINVSNPATPTLIVSFDTPGYAYRVLVSENQGYIADGEAGLQIVNVSDPAGPALLGAYDTPGMAYSVVTSQNYAYVADGEAGLLIVDVSNPADPTLSGAYDTPGIAHGVFVSGGYAYVADMDAGLQIINTSDPNIPTWAGVFDTPGSAHGIFVSGNFAYIADMYAGLQIINVSIPARPTLVGSVDKSLTAMEVFVMDDHAYVTDHKGRLAIYEVLGRP